jgi:cytosine/adenosine deaminase-related metal-dependent hydrolase
MHSLESKDLPIENFYKAVDYLKPKFLVHLVQAKDKEIDYLKGKDIGVVCCPRGNSITGTGFPPIVKLLDNGIDVALGTDNIFLNSPDIFREMEYTSRLIRGIFQNPSIIVSKTVLKMATINGARILGQSRMMGSISSGKKANFILFNKKSYNFVRSTDYISTIVHRAGLEDIACIYLNGNKLS